MEKAGLRILIGTIPEVIGDLTHLIEIDMRRNDIKGPIPASIATLQHLEGLYLHDNYMTGKIPDAISELPALSGVYLFNNCFEGRDESVELFKKNMEETIIEKPIISRVLSAATQTFLSPNKENKNKSNQLSSSSSRSTKKLCLSPVKSPQCAPSPMADSISDDSNTNSNKRRKSSDTESVEDEEGDHYTFPDSDEDEEEEEQSRVKRHTALSAYRVSMGGENDTLDWK
eukprot:gene29862-36983_t